MLKLLKFAEISAILLWCYCSLLNCQVLELDDSFVDKKQNRAWLVEFYAPWCGHCRKLEPIYHHVYLTLRETSDIIVAKVDATRFASLGHMYDVRGYPTIKFIEGDNVYTHSGDRTKEAITEFAMRAKAPRVKYIRNVGKFKDFKGQHSGQVFFMYVGEDDPGSDLMIQFQTVADKYAVYSYFYQGERRVLPREIQPKHDPAIICIKDDGFYEYHSESALPSPQTFEDWFNMERYTVFPKATGGGINEMSDVHKKLVIVVTDENDKENTRHNRFKDIGRLVSSKYRDQYHKDFQFLWMAEKETMEQVTMVDISAPYILVLDPGTHYFYLPTIDMKDMTEDMLVQFIDDVESGKSAPHGGTGILQRFKRLAFDLKGLVVALTSGGWMPAVRRWFVGLGHDLYSIYRESPWLALAVFGVPTLVIGVVCYALCCMEPFDEDEFIEQVAESRRHQILSDRAKISGDTEQQALIEDEVPEPTPDTDGHIKKE